MERKSLNSFFEDRNGAIEVGFCIASSTLNYHGELITCLEDEANSKYLTPEQIEYLKVGIDNMNEEIGKKYVEIYDSVFDYTNNNDRAVAAEGTDLEFYLCEIVRGFKAVEFMMGTLSGLDRTAFITGLNALGVDL
jgi:hypothetical protein